MAQQRKEVKALSHDTKEPSIPEPSEYYPGYFVGHALLRIRVLVLAGCKRTRRQQHSHDQRENPVHRFPLRGGAFSPPHGVGLLQNHAHSETQMEALDHIFGDDNYGTDSHIPFVSVSVAGVLTRRFVPVLQRDDCNALR